MTPLEEVENNICQNLIIIYNLQGQQCQTNIIVLNTLSSLLSVPVTSRNLNPKIPSRYLARLLIDHKRLFELFAAELALAKQQAGMRLNRRVFIEADGLMIFYQMQ